MIEAVRQGDVNKVRELARSGVNVDAPDEDGLTPISVAAQAGHSDTIRVLIEHGANVNAYDRDGHAPVCLAVRERRLDTITALADLGACLNSTCRSWGCSSPLNFAAEHGDVGMIRVLIKHGAKVNIKTKLSPTPLCVASLNGHVDAVCALAELGGDVNISDHNDSSPIFKAAQDGHASTVRTLLEFGANVNAADMQGYTPVWVAAQEGHTATIRILAAHGADVNAYNVKEMSPFYIAVIEGHFEALRVLVEYGADIDTLRYKSNSPVYCAVTHNHDSILMYLISIGANITQLVDNDDADFETPDAVHNMVLDLYDGLQMTEIEADTTADADVFALFAMMKLMSSSMLKVESNTTTADDKNTIINSISGNDDDDGDGDREGFEIAIARAFRQSIATSVVPNSQDIVYPLKREMCRLAYRVYFDTLLFDGERINVETKARRYVELVCFFLNQAMLTDVCALRMTCKSNHERRRFPIYCSTYCELEANLIEGCLGYDACRFVSTSQIHQIIKIHSRY